MLYFYEAPSQWAEQYIQKCNVRATKRHVNSQQLKKQQRDPQQMRPLSPLWRGREDDRGNGAFGGGRLQQGKGSTHTTWLSPPESRRTTRVCDAAYMSCLTEPGHTGGGGI